MSAALMCAAPDLAAEPLQVRNQHPVVALYGLPSPLPARLPGRDQYAMTAALQWSNFASTEARGGLASTLDGEVIDARVRFDRLLAPRVALHGEFAYRVASAGALDRIIEDWHDAFGLPRGSRVDLPRNEFLVEIRNGDDVLLRHDRARSGPADVPLSLGWQLQASDRSALSSWVTVELPVGRARELTGNGAIDVAATLAAEATLSQRWQGFAQANIAWLGSGDLLPARQERRVVSMMAGLTWAAWRGLDLTAQLEANSAVLDTGLDDLDGDALVLTFGGSYRTARGWQFDLGLSEDVDVDASPDVVLHFAVRTAY